MSEQIQVPVLIIGTSGTGKSSSVGIKRDDSGKIISHGLPANKTIILNTEHQPLPIENFGDFTNAYTVSWKKMENALDLLYKAGQPRSQEKTDALDAHFKANPSEVDFRKFDYVVFDSITSATEIISKYATNVYQGFEVWAQYNLMIQDLLTKLKALPQQVFVTSIPEVKDVGFGDTKQYARVKGKELKYGFIEKEFTIVLYTNPIYDDESGELTDVVFKHKSNKFDTTKAPPGMFVGKLPNDMKVVADKVKAFYARTIPKEST